MSSNNSSVSIIVPVYKESERINYLIESLKDYDSLNLKEVIIVDSLGDTINVVNSNLTSWDKLKLVKSEEKGRSKQMNKGANIAKGEILLFLHADTKLPENGLNKIVRLLDNNKYSAGAFDFSFDKDSWFLKLISNVATIRSRLTKIPYGDQAIFVRKRVFDQIGGYFDYPLFEDVDFCRRLKKEGHQIGFIDNRVMSSARRFEKCAICTIMRNWLILSLYYLGIDIVKLEKLYN